MPDSDVDLYILEEPLISDDSDGQNQLYQQSFKKSKIPLINSISKVFNKTAADTKDPFFDVKLKSKFIELNEDFYVSMDVQAYTCAPKMRKNTNPLQYVLSFNPPIMLTNYCMNPLEVFEIDNPYDNNRKQKSLSKLAPSTSSFLI